LGGHVVTNVPPYRIVTERLVLRCWEPRDAPLLKEAVDSSLDHLRPWMPWAEAEPQSLEEKVQLLRTFRGQFDLGQDFVYGIFSRDESEVLGGSGLHRRLGDDALEIGYWIRASRAGEGLGTEMAAALTRVAFEHCDVDRVEIRTEPANERSMAIPRKLGYLEEARLRRRLPAGEGRERRDAVIFTLFREDFPETPSASAQLETFDALGERLR
jgi:RimJ/RimL family protein N-acetyltransferase